MDARLIAAALLVWAGQALAFDHSVWDRLLRRNVVVLEEGRASRVTYAALDRAALHAYLKALSAVGETEFKSWPRAEQMAFLINAYNAFTVEKILTRYPDLESIRDFGRFFGNPFKDDFFTLLGRKASLDAIEHGMLRKDYREPRVHFALNCASIGCPMLRDEAFTAARLEAQLGDGMKRFLSDRAAVRSLKADVAFLEYDWALNDAR